MNHMFWRNDGKYLYVVTDTLLAVINIRTYAVEKCFDPGRLPSRCGYEPTGLRNAAIPEDKG